MKKLFAIAFTCVYLTLAVGVAKTTHYCMGQVNKQSYFSFDPLSCGCALFASSKASSCCDDEQEWIHLDDDQASAPTLSAPPSPLTGFLPSIVLELPSVATQEPKVPVISEPDGIPRPPFYQLYCSLVFYDA